MSGERVDPPKVIDLTEPTGPMGLHDWAELYPALPLRTVALCLWQANEMAKAHGSDEDQNAVIAWLVSERLEEFSVRRQADGPCLTLLADVP
jgi:hypothetical protein